jgi:hypothetical protein
MPIIEENDDRQPETGAIPFELVDIGYGQRFNNTSMDARTQNDELLEELDGLKNKLKAVFMTISKRMESQISSLV